MELLKWYNSNATYLAFCYNLSQHKITRFLLTSCACKLGYLCLIQRLFGILKGRCLIIDDTILAKPFGKKES
jgi:hypothetical protein